VLTCRVHEDVQEFLNLNQEKLLLEESKYNLILGLCNSIKEKRLIATDALFVTLIRNEEIVGQAIRTSKDKPIALTSTDEDASTILINYLVSKNYKLKGVVAPKETAKFFADHWSRRNSLKKTTEMRQGVYELVQVVTSQNRIGDFFLAEKNNEVTVMNFIEGFIKDCFPSEENLKKRAQDLCFRHLNQESLYLLQNEEGEIVSMSAIVRESKNAATISLVYTPEKFRGRGYGSAIVTALSDKILKSGKEKCNLFTDLANSTSNSIYQKIGYKYLGESRHYTFFS